MTPTLAKHLAAVNSGTIERTNVIGIRRAINAMEKGTQWRGSWREKMPEPDDVFAIEQALYEQQPRVGAELHASGVKVLQNPRYAKRWEPWQREAIAAIDHFRLVGFQRIGNVHSVPVYAVWAKVPPKGDALDGGSYEAFFFRNVPWQTAWSMSGVEDGPVAVSREDF